jgi:hypothetical protein
VSGPLGDLWSWLSDVEHLGELRLVRGADWRGEMA